ncbi:hypothetical protein WI1_03801, partial [Escherichia coli KTE97]
ASHRALYAGYGVNALSGPRFRTFVGPIRRGSVASGTVCRMQRRVMPLYKVLVAVLPACQGRVFYISDKCKRIAKQAIFPRITLAAKQVTGNFRHLKTSGNIDIMLCQRTMILQYRR